MAGILKHVKEMVVLAQGDLKRQDVTQVAVRIEHFDNWVAIRDIVLDDEGVITLTLDEMVPKYVTFCQNRLVAITASH